MGDDPVWVHPLYHNSLSGCHTGVTKTCMTISEWFYCLNLAHHVQAYITSCHVCQLLKSGKRFDRPFHKRINLNVLSLTKVSMDIKEMPSAISKTGKPCKFLLVLLCKTSNFVVLVPLQSTTAGDICTAIKRDFIAHYRPPNCIICNQDPAFMSNLTSYFASQLGFKLYTVGITNHKSLLAEHGIKTLSNLLKNIMWHIEGSWTNYLDEAMFMYNPFLTLNLDGLSPFELVFGHQANIIPEMELKPTAPIPVSYRQYLTTLQKQLSFLCKHIQCYRDNRQDVLNQDKTPHGYLVGQLVSLYMPSGAVLQTQSRKYHVNL